MLKPASIPAAIRGSTPADPAQMANTLFPNHLPMKDMNTLRHIAGLYLDIYSSPRDLERPLTPEQVKDAGVFFLDLLAAHEAEALIAQEREARGKPVAELDYRDLVNQFIEKFEQDEGITESLSEDQMYDAGDLFLSYAAEHL